MRSQVNGFVKHLSSKDHFTNANKNYPVDEATLLTRMTEVQPKLLEQLSAPRKKGAKDLQYTEEDLSTVLQSANVRCMPAF